MSKFVWIFDIDSTLADNNHRAELLEKQCMVCLAPEPSKKQRAVCTVCGGHDFKISQSSWGDFLQPDLMSKDKPIMGGIRVLERLRELGAEIHFITGRNGREDMRRVTEAWLQQHAGWDAAKESLIMRLEEEKDLPASVYKERALKRLISDRNLEGANFVFFEDDSHVFNTYSKYGIVVRCPEGWDHLMPDGARGAESQWQR